jgi:hypothetical protein
MLLLNNGYLSNKKGEINKMENNQTNTAGKEKLEELLSGHSERTLRMASLDWNEGIYNSSEEKDSVVTQNILDGVQQRREDAIPYLKLEIADMSKIARWGRQRVYLIDGSHQSELDYIINLTDIKTLRDGYAVGVTESRPKKRQKGSLKFSTYKAYLFDLDNRSFIGSCAGMNYHRIGSSKVTSDEISFEVWTKAKGETMSRYPDKQSFRI